MTAPKYEVSDQARHARQARAHAAAFHAWGKAGAPIAGVQGRPGVQHPTYQALPTGGNRPYWLRIARRHEELLQLYAVAIERGDTADNSRIIKFFEGAPVRVLEA